MLNNDIMSNSSKISIGCWNLNGLYDENNKLKTKNHLFLQETKYLDIIALLETHIGNDTPVAFEGYFPISISRDISKNARYFGGITVFIKNSLRHGVEMIRNKGADYLWLRLGAIRTEGNVYLCICYVPPENSTYTKAKQYDIVQSIEADIAEFAPLGKIIICGDLNGRTNNTQDYVLEDENTSLNDDYKYTYDNFFLRQSQDSARVNGRGQQILDLCMGSRMRILNGRILGDSVGHFTCHKWNGSSVADYMLASEELFPCIRYFRVHPFHDEMSDHCLISAEFQLGTKRQLDLKIEIQPMPVKFNFDDASSNNFQIFLTRSEVLENINKINQIKHSNAGTQSEMKIKAINDIMINSAIKAEVVHRRMNAKHKKRQPKAKWHDHKYVEMKREVQKLGANMTKDPFNKTTRLVFYALRKKVRRANKEMKRLFIKNIVTKLDKLQNKDPKSFWKLINELHNINHKEIDDPTSSISPGEWINYYKQLNSSKVPKLVEETFKDLLNKNEKWKTFSELDYTITEKEIIEATNKLKNGKAAGTDGIHNEMLKHAMTHIMPCLHPLLNEIFSTSNYPKQWAEVYIFNIHKSGKVTDPFNYRGISVGSAMGKLLSIIMNNRVIRYLVKNNLLSECQIGFIKGCRTADHIFVLRTLIEKYIKRNKQQLFICFVDLKKAFDTVWHTGLLHKLQEAGINGQFYQLLKSMYSQITYRLKVKDGLTAPEPSNIGVRQGDVLSPILFNIYLNDLVGKLENDESNLTKLNNETVPVLMYADDLALISTSEKGLQSQVDQLYTFCSKWQLEVNTSKTKTMVISNRKSPAKIETRYNDTVLEQVNTFPYLGITLNNKGNFEQNKINMINKCTKAFYKLWRSSKNANLSVKSLFHLYDHTIKPILVYGSEVTFTFNLKKRKGELHGNFEDFECKGEYERIHKKMIRYTLGINNKTSIDAIYAEVGRYPIYNEMVLNSLKYEQRLSTADPKSLVSKAYKESNLLNQEGKITTWMTQIKYIKQVLNIIPGREAQNKNTGRTAEKHMKDRFREHWKVRLMSNISKNGTPSSGNKLRTYRKLKNIYKCEPYLEMNSHNLRKPSADSELAHIT